ncbi:hypothetical protein KIW84_057867 [Lathyrus oleraceus]|uniref:Uncharacterized protein n=1 Tax=Pisum sativum TaxID=3888 RepID=A0A9D5AN82_PEA|nr:hypothetical protein KIW84_057867 [Pisum sativum]
MKNNSYRPHFAAPDSSSTRPASSSAAPAFSSTAPTSIGASSIDAQMTTNVDISDSKLWPDFVPKAFFDIMVDEVTKGNMSNDLGGTQKQTQLLQVKRSEEIILSLDDDLHEVEHITRSGKRQVQIRSKKESTSHMMGETLSAWAKSSLAKAERYMDRSVEATSRITSDNSLTKCVTVLDEMEDIPHDAYGKALEKFMNPDWKEVFITMSVKRKRGWDGKDVHMIQRFFWTQLQIKMLNFLGHLELMSPYKPYRQRLIVIVCCATHNYIHKWNLPDELFRIWEEMDPIELEGIQEGHIIEGISSNVDNLTRLSNEGAPEMTMKRNHIRDEIY